MFEIAKADFDSGISEHLAEHDRENLIDLYSERREELPQLNRYSYILCIIAFSEYKLHQFAEGTSALKNTSIKLSDINGRGIRRTRIFLEKVIGINVNNIKEWDFIASLTTVRNFIAHNYGLLNSDDEKRKKVEQFFQNNPEFGSIKNSKIAFSDQFITTSSKIINSFFKSLYTEFETWVSSDQDLQA
ncbi:hypothetical protein HUU42_09610 [bacterium]|nr:hypothetical protein [bacterium]